ncbi:uncharacterized protein LOC110270204 isoform X1 [Arachis ipaensis]|uniref:uncharacterized protein LOC110270204 isoform X1 n=1 Tax=Arachis ipaensis TaxID=130454 RepID=UPI000A2AF0D0|nr:uncharacterized protein LOC110270204 isoform X1 [Arachis ipaensis]XP_029147458.1 uncharacterized protein LOC112738428 isoform X1 [Arachis hypogaea]
MIRIIKVHLQLAILLPHQFRVLFHLLLVHLYTNPYQEPTLLHLLASQIPLDTLIPAFQFPVLPKGFKCLNATGKVYIARNVLFDESSMFPSLNTNCSTASSVSTSFIPQIPQVTPISSTDSVNSAHAHSSNNHILSALPFISTINHSSHHTNFSSSHQIAFDTIPISGTATHLPPLTSTSASSNIHPMITRLKSGISKPKAFNVISSYLDLVQNPPRNIK